MKKKNLSKLPMSKVIEFFLDKKYQSHDKKCAITMEFPPQKY